MAEILPDGSFGGYTGYCQKCKKEISTNIQGNEIGVHYCSPEKEEDWILVRAAGIHGICTFHLNDDFAKYCDLFIKGGYNGGLVAGQKRLRKICNQLEKKGLLWSEWGGTGKGGGWDFGVKRYKAWYSIQNKWNKK